MENLILNSTASAILFEPLTIGANHLCILTNNAAPSMASWLLKSYERIKVKNVEISLIVRNYMNDGIYSLSHQSFIELHNSTYSNSLSCSYLYKTVNSKDNFYIWLKDDTPIVAFSCSFDFSQISFVQAEQCIYTSVNAAEAFDAYEKAVDNSIYCNHAELEDYIVILPTEKPVLSVTSFSSEQYVVLSLVTKRTGEPGKRSGLNWGQRKKRNKNEAYIPLPRKIAKSGFFPLDEQHFLVLTDDYHTLQLRVEQGGDKAITTPASNALLGEYFRNRLGLANGAYVNRSDLLKYGRLDVTFYKFDDEQFYMDFSPNIKDD